VSAVAAGVRRRVEHVMGTAVVIEVRAPEAVADAVGKAVEAAFEHLRDIDRRFSTYKPDSEISRLNSGELPLAACSADVRAVLAMCEEARLASDGYFDIAGHRSDGTLDPSGMVKGWSVDGAARILAAAGISSYNVNAAGDILLAGAATAGQPWRIGIRHPWAAQSLAAVVELGELAIATSGTYERGEHVIDPHTGRPPAGVASMTVVGPSLTWADTWATAAFAMGVRGVDWIAREIDGYEACAISTDRHLIMTAGFERLLAGD
jgi:thiamine biosynthesis lipoprotein